MVEGAQDIALAFHARRQPLGPGQPRQLQRQLALQLAVDALREPDGALPTPTDELDDPIGADLIARLGLSFRRGRLGHPRQRVEEGLGLDAGLPREQPAQGLLQGSMFGGQALEPRLALRRLQGERLVEEPVDDRPLRGEIGEQLHRLPSVAER